MATLTPGMFSSDSQDYSTPKWFFDMLDHLVGRFHLDPCATEITAKCPRYFTKEDDGLSLPWYSARLPRVVNVWINSPYRGIYDWCSKTLEEHRRGANAVQLAACRTETKWFQDHAPHTTALWFPNKRLKFSHPCLTCGKLTHGRYYVPGISNKTVPLCKEHRPADQPSRNAPTFPSVVMFYLHTDVDWEILRPHGLVITAKEGYHEQRNLWFGENANV